VPRWALVALAAALAALPAAGLAAAAAGDPGDTIEGGPAEGDEGVVRTSQYGSRPKVPDKALQAQGNGTLSFRGSGGTTIVLARDGTIKVKDESPGARLATTRTGGIRVRSTAGRSTVFAGKGTIALNGSAYRMDVASRDFRATLDAAPGNRLAGVATASGKGSAALEGGAPVAFSAAHRIILGRGRIRLDIRKAAFWRLAGPANGTVDMTISDRLRVWDHSGRGQLSVTGVASGRSKVLKDGSTLYWGLRNARVVVAGSAFRMRVRSTAMRGTFTPAAGALVRSVVSGSGEVSTVPTDGGGPVLRESVTSRVARILIQP
jgi:hypothetical protein